MPKEIFTKKKSLKQIVDYSSWQLIKDIAEFLKPYKRRFIVASIIRLLGDLAWLYPAFALASIVTFLTQYKAGQSLTPLWMVIGLWSGAVVIRSLSQYFAKYLGYQIAEKLAIDSALKTVQHMFLLDMTWHERENSGNKIKRIQNAGEGFNKILRIWFNNIIGISVNLVAINIIIARFDHTVLLLLLLFLATYFIISSTMTRKAGEASYKVNAQEENVNGLLFEAINNIRIVKVMVMAKTLYAILVKDTEELLKRIGIRVFWYQSLNTLLLFWAASFKIGIIMVIIRGILEGHYEIGFLILFNSYFSDLRESIDELSNSSVDFITSKLSVARMKYILNEPIKIDDENGKGPFLSGWKKIIVKKSRFLMETIKS